MEIYQFILNFTSRTVFDRAFVLSQSQMMERIINHVGLEVSVSLQSREMLTGKPLLNKEESSLGRKCVWNYRASVGMLSSLQG